MSSDEKTIYYTELRAGDPVQDGDQWLDSFGQWHPYVCNDQISGVVFSGVKARRPIRTTHQTTYEEVPGGRTLQQAVEQPQRKRIAYEELRPGDVIQAGDEHRNADGRWHAYDLSLCGSRVHGAWDGRARRPYKISAILEIGDALANAQKAATQLQDERDEARNERDLARAEVARLSTELWARKPLEDRVASLVDEVKQLQAERQEWSARFEAEVTAAALVIDELSAAKDALKSAQRARDELQRQVDELREQQSPVTPADQLSFYELTEKRIASLEDDLSQVRADRDKLQGLIDDLVEEPTARQVQDMLRTWATELDWSAGCFGSFGRSQIDIIQQTMIAVIQRIGSMIDPEATSADA